MALFPKTTTSESLLKQQAASHISLDVQKIPLETNVSQETTSQSQTPVVIAEKYIHAGRLHGAIGNGNAQFDLGNGKGIKFTLTNNPQFVCVQLLEGGIGVPIKNQSWNRVKVEKVMVKKPQPPQKEVVTIQEEIGVSDLL